MNDGIQFDKKQINQFLKNHYDCTLRKFDRGDGSFSKVIKVGRNRMLKISVDPYWYILMKWLQKKNCAYLPTFNKDYGVIGTATVEFANGERTQVPVYAVEMPKYEPARGRSAEIQEILYKILYNSSLTEIIALKDKSLTNTVKLIKQFINLSDSSIRKLAKQAGLSSIITQQDMNLRFDMHDENMMMFNDEPIILDPIYCKRFHRMLS